MISPSASIADALRTIDRGAAAIALVTDERGRLLGTVSDGDIRRAMLSGKSLDDPVEPHIHSDARVVLEGTGRAEVLDLMAAQSLNQVPVVDSEGKLVSLHLVRELIGHGERPNWAVIMAGGRGTRLAPLTDEVPKPMLRVAGRPILERIVLHLVGAGIDRIFISTGYLGDQVEDHFSDGSALGCRIEYLRDEPDRPLGSGGALRLLVEKGLEPDQPLLVMNGDLVTDFSIDHLLSSHEGSGAPATVAVRPYGHTVPFGVVEVNEDRVTALIEKPTHTCLVNAGIYVLAPELLPRIPAGREFHVPELLQDCLRRGDSVNVWETDADWQDIGRPSELHRAAGHGVPA